MASVRRGNFQDDSSSSEAEDTYHEEDEEDAKEKDEEEDDGIDNLPVLNAIIKKGKIDSAVRNNQDFEKDDAERIAIRQELSALSFEELQKLKEKLGSKKFNQTLRGKKKNPEQEVDYKRVNKNRPREMSSKSRRIEPKVAVQVAKVFRSDPRFDGLCGEFNEKKFNRNYEFVSEMKVEEVEKLKEELKEETNPRRIDKIKYLIQRMENQIRSEKKRKEDEAKQHEERQVQIEAMNEGKFPHFATQGNFNL